MRSSPHASQIRSITETVGPLFEMGREGRGTFAVAQAGVEHWFEAGPAYRLAGLSELMIAMSCRSPVFLHEQVSERKFPNGRNPWVNPKIISNHVVSGPSHHEW